MTREEKTISVLYGIRADNLNLDNAYIKDKYDALTLAIKALEQEPKTGHWIVEKGGSYLGKRNGCCSNCKDFYTNDWNVMNYCPNCGAYMRGDK